MPGRPWWYRIVIGDEAGQKQLIVNCSRHNQYVQSSSLAWQRKMADIKDIVELMQSQQPGIWRCS